jgi:hypothetical protein
MKLKKSIGKLYDSKKKYEEAKLKFIDRVFRVKYLTKKLGFNKELAKRNLDLYLKFKSQICGYDINYVIDNIIEVFDHNYYFMDIQNFIDLKTKEAIDIGLKYDKKVDLYVSREGYLGLSGLQDFDITENDIKKLNGLGFKQYKKYWFSSMYLYKPETF